MMCERAYAEISRHVGLSCRFVTLACHDGSSRSAVSNKFKQTRGGANIKLVPLDSIRHGACITNFGPQGFRYTSARHVQLCLTNKLEGVPA